MAYEQLPDEALFEACSRGELRAFEHLLQRHHQPVYNFMYWQVGDGALVDDLLQEAFLRLLVKRRRSQQTSFATFLYAIVRELCLRESRRGAGPPRRTGDRPGTERTALDAIEDLDHEHREVFLLREYLDLPFREIAEIVGCEQHLVKERMRHALEQLRKEMARERRS